VFNKIVGTCGYTHTLTERFLERLTNIGNKIQLERRREKKLNFERCQPFNM